jgi:hypothetical protein
MICSSVNLDRFIRPSLPSGRTLRIPGGVPGGQVSGVTLRSNFSASVVLLFWAVAPVALALIESLVSTPIFLDRYFIGSLPALFTLAAVGAAHLLSRQKWPTTVGAAIVLAATIVENLDDDTDHHDDWRSVAAYLQDNLQNSDCVLVYPHFNITPLRYYLRREFCAILPTGDGEIDGQVIGATRTFVVFSHDEMSENLSRAASAQQRAGRP